MHLNADFEDDGDHVPLIVPHTPTLDVSEWIPRGEDLLSGALAGVSRRLDVHASASRAPLGAT